MSPKEPRKTRTLFSSTGTTRKGVGCLGDLKGPVSSDVSPEGLGAHRESFRCSVRNWNTDRVLSSDSLYNNWTKNETTNRGRKGVDGLGRAPPQQTERDVTSGLWASPRNLRERLRHLSYPGKACPLRRHTRRDVHDPSTPRQVDFDWGTVSGKKREGSRKRYRRTTSDVPVTFRGTKFL